MEHQFGEHLDVKTIASELQKLGYESYGNEVLYNGLTGEQLETSIFIGPSVLPKTPSIW